jgi:hypothetical protein
VINIFPIFNFATKCNPKVHVVAPNKKKSIEVPRWHYFGLIN